MTVSTIESNINYVADGAQTVFTFTYKVYAVAHMTVYLDDILQGAGFSINLNPDQDTTPGGDVTFDTAPANLVNVTLLRAVPLTQLVDYTPFDAFPAKTHERALDLGIMASQQLQDELSRADVGPPSGGPPPTGEANTASNLPGDEGLASAKVLTDLPFKSLTAGTNIALSSDANEVVVAAPLAVPSNVSIETGSVAITNLVSLTQAAYDALTPKPASLYVIVN